MHRLPTALIKRPDLYLHELRMLRDTAALHMQNSTFTKRETLTYGFSYFGLAKGDRSFIDIPPSLINLCGECIGALGRNGIDVGSTRDYTNVIASFYGPGYQLEPHVDVDRTHMQAEGSEANFYFGENVIGVVLHPDVSSGVDDPGSFYVADASSLSMSPIVKLDETPGLVYLLTGCQRRAPFAHGVTKVNHSRVSVTFRTVHFI